MQPGLEHFSERIEHSLTVSVMSSSQVQPMQWKSITRRGSPSPIFRQGEETPHTSLLCVTALFPWLKHCNPLITTWRTKHKSSASASDTWPCRLHRYCLEDGEESSIPSSHLLTGDVNRYSLPCKNRLPTKTTTDINPLNIYSTTHTPDFFVTSTDTP